MAEKLGEAAAPLGAPEIAPDPGEEGGYEITGRPRLGGLKTPLEFTEKQTDILNAVADELIPPGEGFPAPSEVDVVGFIARYVTPSGYEAKHYPFAAEDNFKADVDSLGDDFLSADSNGSVEALKKVEKDNEEFFEQLRSLVYYGYYSRTEVTMAIRANIPAGRDYHGPPLPEGYIRCIEPWDDEILAARGGGSGYIATEDVERIDLGKIEWFKNK